MAIGLFDTNILVDCLAGIQEARNELHLFPDRAISSITWIEITAWLKSRTVQQLSAGDQAVASAFIQSFKLIHIDDAIMVETARLRGESLVVPPKLPLPDALILATANITGRWLITRDKKDFRGTKVRTPYELIASGSTVSVVKVAPPLDD
jgi:predicted nucleic acid-binding protein